MRSKPGPRGDGRTVRRVVIAEVSRANAEVAAGKDGALVIEAVGAVVAPDAYGYASKVVKASAGRAVNGRKG